MTVRPPAVAGLFYPDAPAALAASVQRTLQPRPAGPAPKLLVVPHAGYIYSAPVAGPAYALLQGAHAIRRVVLLGPNHRVALRGMAVPTVAAFDTPLGPVPIDAALRQQVATLPGVILHDLPHQQEHSLEVQLPFLQQVLDPGFTLLPVVVGDCPPEQVAALLEVAWGGLETLIVISTDLSHYLPYDEAVAVDAATSALIEAMEPVLHPQQACGAHPLNGALLAARRHGLVLRCVQRANSGDTAGGKDRVVGYGAYAG